MTLYGQISRDVRLFGPKDNDNLVKILMREREKQYVSDRKINEIVWSVKSANIFGQGVSLCPEKENVARDMQLDIGNT